MTYKNHRSTNIRDECAIHQWQMCHTSVRQRVQQFQVRQQYAPLFVTVRTAIAVVQFYAFHQQRSCRTAHA